MLGLAVKGNGLGGLGNGFSEIGLEVLSQKKNGFKMEMDQK